MQIVLPEKTADTVGTGIMELPEVGNWNTDILKRGLDKHNRVPATYLVGGFEWPSGSGNFIPERTGRPFTSYRKRPIRWADWQKLQAKLSTDYPNAKFRFEW